ncbi:hypothetical protein C0073_016170 [Aeromonas veronii]|nr:hypothetical protein C0073_016170 [Aeromonas veronii]
MLGASNYTFAEATGHSHCRTGCKAMSVPLSFRRYPGTADPRQPQERCQQGLPIRSELNPSYQQLAEHYQVAVMPARPYKPKDKAKAEVGVQIVERWIRPACAIRLSSRSPSSTSASGPC